MTRLLELWDNPNFRALIYVLTPPAAGAIVAAGLAAVWLRVLEGVDE